MISLWWWKIWNYTEWNDIEVTTMKSPITTESGRVQVTSCTRDSPPSWRGRVQSRAGVPARPECARAAVWACRRAQCWWRGPTSWRREPGALSLERRSQTSCNTRLSAACRLWWGGSSYLKGGGRTVLVFTSVRMFSIICSVVMASDTSLITMFLMFLWGKDLMTLTGMVTTLTSVILSVCKDVTS